MEDRGQFSALDYSFFVIVFFISAVIGLYYALKARKEKITVDEYLLGGRKMALAPVACSLAATALTGGSMVGMVAETYMYGTHAWLLMFAMFVMATVVPSVFLPVLSELNLTSGFQYFEMRFNRLVRKFASAMYLFTGLIYLPVTVYIPALMFQKVTGINIYLTVAVLSFLCASYTAVGGFKAVVWTDVVQLLLMIISYIITILIGIYSVGGIGNVIETASRGGRLIAFNTQDLNTRSSILGYLISNPLLGMYQFGLNQTSLQRFLSLPNLKLMKASAWILSVLFSAFLCMAHLLGVVIYANYESCDPYTVGIIHKVDQILPHFVQEKANLFPGFNGIFIAGIFSAGLSSTSSYLNAMSGIIFEDFFKPKYPTISTDAAGRIMKYTVIILGLLQIFLVFFIEKMGMIMQITTQCMALNAGALLTLFILGILVPKANSKGAIIGALTAILSLLVLIVGSIDKKSDPPLAFRTDGCSGCFNDCNTAFERNSTQSNASEDKAEIFWLFNLSYIYYGLVGTLIGVLTGYLISVLTGGKEIKNQKLLATFFRKTVFSEEQTKLHLLNIS